MTVEKVGLDPKRLYVGADRVGFCVRRKIKLMDGFGDLGIDKSEYGEEMDHRNKDRRVSRLFRVNLTNPVEVGRQLSVKIRLQQSLKVGAHVLVTEGELLMAGVRDLSDAGLSPVNPCCRGTMCFLVMS